MSLQSVMTHAEAASNHDGRLMHDNYGLMFLVGIGERWDLMQLEKNGPSDGGDQLRQRNRALPGGDPESASPVPLAYEVQTFNQVQSMDLHCQIDALGRSWAIAAYHSAATRSPTTGLPPSAAS